MRSLKHTNINNIVKFELTWLNKIVLFLFTIKNPIKLLADRLGMKEDILYTTYNGTKFIARSKSTDINEAVVILSGYEYPVENLEIVRDRPVVIDAGAHIGLFSLYIKFAIPNAQLYLIEPLESNINRIAKNFKLNRLKFTSLTKGALDIREGTKDLYLKKGHDSATLVKTDKEVNEEKESVSTINLKTLVKRNKILTVDVLKMDIEGLEYAVLKNDISLLRSSVRYIVLEYHPRYDATSKRKIIRLLKKNGFKQTFEKRHVLGFLNSSL